MSKNAAESREPESHEVVLLGKKYKLRSPHDDEYLAKLANFVTAQVAEVQRRGAVGSLDAALLAALNIADELFRQRQEAEARLAEVGEKTQALLAALDEMEPARAGEAAVDDATLDASLDDDEPAAAEPGATGPASGEAARPMLAEAPVPPAPGAPATAAAAVEEPAARKVETG